VGRNEAAAIDAFTRDLAGFHKADSAHYDALLHGCVAEAPSWTPDRAAAGPQAGRDLAHRAR
jgi:hypothetical protein